MGKRDKLLSVLVDMELLSTPQRAMVIATLLGLVVGAAVSVKGLTEAAAREWAIGQMAEKISEVKRNEGSDTDGAPDR